MDKNRILELAIETLQAQKNAIEDEIAQLRGEIPQLASEIAPQALTTSKRPRGSRTVAQRKAHSKRMKAIWAARKAKAPKPTGAKKSASAKGKPELSAANKSRAEKMKAYWAQKRKAGTAKKSA
jgi:hypothetical protein